MGSEVEPEVQQQRSRVVEEPAPERIEPNQKETVELGSNAERQEQLGLQPKAAESNFAQPIEGNASQAVEGNASQAVEGNATNPYGDYKAAPADYMAKLMADSKDVLGKTSAGTEAIMASSMQHEMGANQRRANLTLSWDKKTKSGWSKEAETVRTAMAEKDPKKQEAALAALGRDGKLLHERAKAGLDLNDREQVTSAAVDIRTNQYGRMSELDAKDEKDLTKEEKAELADLQGIKGVESLGFKGKMGDYWGMSEGRYGEIFDKGNSRFEPSHYQKLRDSYVANRDAHDAQAAAHAAKPDKVKAPGDTIAMKSAIGQINVTASGQEKMKENFDLVADAATSYSGAQVMGAYAKSDDYVPNGGKHLEKTDIAALKAASARTEPNKQDVGLMLDVLQMKGIDSSKTMTDDAYIKAYNGSSPTKSTELYTPYKHALETKVPAYNEAKAALAKAAAEKAAAEKSARR